jgi:hypothetical protein
MLDHSPQMIDEVQGKLVGTKALWPQSLVFGIEFEFCWVHSTATGNERDQTLAKMLADFKRGLKRPLIWREP